MEGSGSPGRWAQRVIVAPSQDGEREDTTQRYGTSVRTSNASPVTVSTTTFELHQSNVRNNSLRPRSVSSTTYKETVRDAILSRAPSLSSLSASRSTSASPRSVDSLNANSLRPRSVSSTTYRETVRDAILSRAPSLSSLIKVDGKPPKRTGSRPTHLSRPELPSCRDNRLVSRHSPANELINESKQPASKPRDTKSKQDGRLVTRLSAKHLQQADSHHHHTAKQGQPTRRRRKSIDVRSCISDDTNLVSDGYGSLTCLAQDDEKADDPAASTPVSSGPRPQLLRRRRSSVAVVEKSARDQYLKEFNDAIRLRNAKSSASRQQRNKTVFDPTTGSQLVLSRDRWKRLRLLVRSAPTGRGRGTMDNGSSESWEDFVALGMPADELVELERLASTSVPPRPSPRSINHITSSHEHERILHELKFSTNTNYNKTAAFKSSILVVAGGIKNMKINDSKTPSPRLKDATKYPDVDVVVEEDESDSFDLEPEETKYDQEGKPIKKLRSRGWRIVKKRLSEIAEKAPKNGIDSTPMTFRNIAQLVKAKQFRMMLKRRASFMENGRFQFDEAKQDLYARYKLDPALISKLIHTPRDSLSGDGAQKK